MNGPSPALYTPEFFQDPYPALTWLRRHDPVHEFVFPGTDVPVYLVTRYADVLALLQDARFSNDYANAGRQFLAAGLGFAPLGRNVLMADPPDHTRLRKLAMKAFTPRNVEIWRGVVEEMVDDILCSVGARGEMDVVNDLATVIPADVIGRILGMDADRREGLSEQMKGVASGVPGRVRESLETVLDYTRELVAAKRAHPMDDLTSHLIETRDGSDRLDEAELVTMVATLIVAGFETTQNLIANAVLALLDHPEQLELLRKDLSIVPQAVEELLRYAGALAVSGWRFATHDLEFAGAALPAGAAVLGGLLSANRDPERFADPDRLDLSRRDVRHIGFGHGLHNCLGAALARLEVRIVLSMLISRFPEWELTVTRSHIRYEANIFSRRPESLPVRFCTM
ncbi:cytochrome P450 [Microbispora sp. NEAU-D428]|uniref:cytochrome P450 family protein n=1 Tax=Microbispora sitophila TaxID=2771537 RepID=UPI0018664A9C|nr:cytochrome P450 [Microbispora sitophila]MBE3014790.1 cytochrome P450 [Microbispora sitophila]